MEKHISKISPKIIISGGGTGGHIYPAIAIADEIKERFPLSEILFVGAEGKMEMEKVPKSGYDIKGLPIVGFNRSNLVKNIGLPLKLFKSISSAKKIVKDFNPDFAIGTGGFASGPLLWAAGSKKVPVLLQEQNAFAGITNKLLVKRNKAQKVCVAYKGMEVFFDNAKVHLTGNPIRVNMFENLPSKQEARKNLGLDLNKFTILSVGGSLGARSINNAWVKNIETIKENDDVQLLWQTGKLDYKGLSENQSLKHPDVHLSEFIYNMQDAYAAADVVVSRAGAIAISELCLVGKPCIFVPLPTAAEDHQTKNAMKLVEENAAILVKNSVVSDELSKEILRLKEDKNLQESLANNIVKMAKPEATKEIVDILFG